LDLRGRKWQEAEEDCIMRSFMTCTLHQILFHYHIIRVIKSRNMRWTGHVARMAEMKNPYKVLVRKPEYKKPYGRRRFRWVDNIRMDFIEVG
jgi:hypothetical protein